MASLRINVAIIGEYTSRETVARKCEVEQS